MVFQTKRQWSEAFIKSCKTGDLHQLRHLCQKKYLDFECADIHGEDEAGFRMACKEGQLEIVKYLLTSKELIQAGHTFANLHADDEDGILMACAYGYLEIVKYLLTSPELKASGHAFAEFHANDEDVFHLGCLNGQLEVVKYLLTSTELIEAGHTWADVHAKNDRGLLWACEMRHDNVVRWLVFDYGIKKTPSIEQIMMKYPQVQEYFRVREELKEMQDSLHHQKPVKSDPSNERTDLGALKKAKKL